MSQQLEPVLDSFGRVHRNLRVGVTDRCNIRCFYCMPNENVQFLPYRDILSFEEIASFVRAVVPLGIDRIRVTGGEPLVRRELWKLMEQLSAIDGLQDIALTTNGVLLAAQAQALFESGLQRLNISLDTVDEDVFQQITRRTGLQKVFDGIQRAKEVGFKKIRINAVSIAGITEPEIVPLADFARRENLELRFIEFMPLDAEGNWQSQQVLSGEAVKRIIEAEVGTLVEADRPDPSQPAVDFEYVDGSGRVGFINPVTAPFCGNCDRLRITAKGQLRNCLFSDVNWDVRELLRANASEDAIQQLVRDCIAHKKAGHGMDADDFHRPTHSMYQIGG